MQLSLCGSCRRRYWPYVMGLFVSGVSAYLTWLTLDVAGIDHRSNEKWTVSLFFGILACTWTYTYTCIRRHCRSHRVHDPAEIVDS